MGADAEEDRLESEAGTVAEQILHREVASQLRAGTHVDTEPADVVEIAFQDGARAPITGQAHREHSPEAVLLLEHRDPVTLAGEVEGARETRRAGADNGDTLRVPALGWVGLGLGLMLPLPVHDETLQRSDGKGCVNVGPAAGILTRRVAHPPAHERQRVALPDESGRLRVPSRGNQCDVARGVLMDGACLHARRLPLPIDDVGARNRLGKRLVNGGPLGEELVEGVRHRDRAHLDALPARRT